MVLLPLHFSPHHREYNYTQYPFISIVTLLKNQTQIGNKPKYLYLLTYTNNWICKQKEVTPRTKFDSSWMKHKRDNKMPVKKRFFFSIGVFKYLESCWCFSMFPWQKIGFSNLYHFMIKNFEFEVMKNLEMQN